MAVGWGCSEIKDEEYDNFYKSLTKDEKGSLNHIHFKAEGEISFKSILYVPKKAPDNYYDRFYEKSNALKVSALCFLWLSSLLVCCVVVRLNPLCGVM